jgi:hypothetical protein
LGWNIIVESKAFSGMISPALKWHRHRQSFKPMASYSSIESTTHDYGQWTDAKWHQQLATTSFEPWATRDHVDQAKVGETKLTFNYPSNEFHQIARTVLKIRAQPQWIHTLSEEFHSHSVSQTAHRRKFKQFSNRCILAVLTLCSLYNFDFIWATERCDTFTFCHGNGAKVARHIHNLYSFYSFYSFECVYSTVVC